MASQTAQVRKEAITDIEETLGRTEQKLRFVEMRASGHSYLTISKALRVSKGTLTNWSRELEAEIATAKALELEALQEEFYLLKERRIRLLGGLLERLRLELESRDLCTIATDKLLDLLLRVYGDLQAERIEVRPLSDEDRLRLEKDRSKPDLNARELASSIQDTLTRYRSGSIEAEQAKQELSLLQALLKAQEQTVLEEKLDRVEAVLTSRRS
jgi:hypothetical protein